MEVSLLLLSVDYHICDSLNFEESPENNLCDLRNTRLLKFYIRFLYDEQKLTESLIDEVRNRNEGFEVIHHALERVIVKLIDEKLIDERLGKCDGYNIEDLLAIADNLSTYSYFPFAEAIIPNGSDEDYQLITDNIYEDCQFCASERYLESMYEAIMIAANLSIQKLESFIHVVGEPGLVLCYILDTEGDKKEEIISVFLEFLTLEDVINAIQSHFCYIEDEKNIMIERVKTLYANH